MEKKPRRRTPDFSRPLMSADQAYISFPPGSVDDIPLRLPLLWDSAAGVALNKPPGLPAFQDTRFGGGARSILTDLNTRAAAGASQLERLGIHRLSLLNQLEREASGILLFAKDQEARAELKNAMGSSRFTFRYHFLTAAQSADSSLSCDLPVAIHRQKPLALVSHRTGKKTSTLFRRLDDFGPCSLWESESEYDRFHQIRLHAAEAGIPVLGDSLYGPAAGEGAPKLPARLQSLLSEGGFFLHLFALAFPMEGQRIELEAQYPGRFRMLLKKLAR